MKNKEQSIYAFIDSQNLNFGTSKDIFKNHKLGYSGWKLDMQKFRIYLRDKFRVQKAFLFIGYIKELERMYESFRSFGYELIFKTTVKGADGKPKGNVDAEIVLNAARLKYDEFDKGVFVSGDGDFYCLYKFLEEKNKLCKIIIPNKFNESSLLKEFQNRKIFLYREKSKLILKK